MLSCTCTSHWESSTPRIPRLRRRTTSSVSGSCSRATILRVTTEYRCERGCSLNTDAAPASGSESPETSKPRSFSTMGPCESRCAESTGAQWCKTMRTPTDEATRNATPAWTAVLPIGVACALLAGGVAWLAGYPGVANGIWAAALIVVGAPLTVSVARRIRRGQPGADVIALLAIGGALAFGEFVAGAVIALMLAGGDYLDARAFGRARRELGVLASRAPVTAHFENPDGTLEDIPAERVETGDAIVVKQGELIPVDAIVV